MKEQLKASVLAKCEEIAPEKDTNYGLEKFNIERVNSKTTLYTDWGFVSFSANTPDDSDAWDFAASILKVGRFSIPQKVWEDHIKEGLDEARQMGHEQGKAEAYAEFGKFGPKEHAFTFDDFIATLPPDPLAKDQDELAFLFKGNSSIDRDLERDGYSPEFIALLKRLAGMEVTP